MVLLTLAKKGKDTPTANDLAPVVSMPVKPPTLMKKRGEEDLESRYLSKILPLLY